MFLTSLSGRSCIFHLYIQWRVNIIHYINTSDVNHEPIWWWLSNMDAIPGWDDKCLYWDRAARESYTNNWKSVREYWVSFVSDCSNLSKAILLYATRAYTQGFEKQVQTNICEYIGLHPRKPERDKAGAFWSRQHFVRGTQAIVLNRISSKDVGKAFREEFCCKALCAVGRCIKWCSGIVCWSTEAAAAGRW